MKQKQTYTSNPKSARLRSLKRFLGLLFCADMYCSYVLSGLYKQDLDVSNLKENIEYCLMHPQYCYNEKSLPVMLLGLIVWLVVSLSLYNKYNMNLMHGKEYGDAKWGDIGAFNKKYADSENPSANKIFSANIRFKYDSSTLRNNNTFVVGGSGSGKTSFFLTPNLLNMHGCNVFTDPKGTLVEELGPYLAAQPDTRVYTINMCDMRKSDRINPFLFVESASDITKLITNLIHNTENANIKASSQDPFWQKAEKMFLESIFLYVWLECPRAVLVENSGEVKKLERDLRSVMYLINEAGFGEDGEPPRLDTRMEMLEKKKPDHPAVRAYKRYRGGPDETVRSVLMTVNARMQPFDNGELLDVFATNEVPLDQVGVGIDGDKKTKTNIFIVIPDDDDTYNFVPGMIYTLLFQKLYSQARFFGGRLPMDVGFYLDEFANTKMPSNFDKILATCRSRGIYCIPMLQSLAQIKTLFADGAWEGVVGNCDTFLYLGGNEASTFEYISKLLGKWTIDKKTSGESKGSSGSVSENYDVLGRELMNEYEVRLLPNDECILFVRGEEPLRDKKWYPWEHEEYRKAREFVEKVREERELCDDLQGVERFDDLPENSYGGDGLSFINEDSFLYMKKQKQMGENIRIESMDAFDFMMMDLDKIGDKKVLEDPVCDILRLQELTKVEEKEAYESRKLKFMEDYDNLDIFSVYASEFISDTRKRVIRELGRLKNPPDERTILRIVDPRGSEEEMMEKKKIFEEMRCG